MHWYQWFSLISLIICLGSCLYHLIHIIRLGKPVDYSHKTGNVTSAVKFSFTGAMSPAKKESAFLHLPTYTAGMIYHVGTFLSVFLYFILLFGVPLPSDIRYILAGILGVTGLSGLAILIKRMLLPKLRSLSNADDYISNILATGFQLVLSVTLLFPSLMPSFFITAGILMLYLPVGKLRHAVYFFAARYHLGFFFGWRNVWPPKSIQ